MSEPTGRGTVENLLDPSNPSISKQTMLDWLRINHPKTVIKSKANKDEVAKIVREQQPRFFPNPESDAPAVTSETLHRYPPLEDLRVSSPITSKPLETTKDPVIKRSASQDLETPHPHKRIGIDLEAQPATPIGFGSRIPKKKKTSSRRKPSNIGPARPAKPLVTDWLHSVATASPKVSKSIENAIKSEDDKRELEELKHLLFSPLVDLHGASQDLTSSSSHQSKPQEQDARITNQNCASVPEDVDLIHFSDTEVFEVGNLVIGRDIPTIKTQKSQSPSNKKTGVDVFQEEQQREEKVRTLEERLARLECSFLAMEKKSSDKMFQDLQQEQVNAAAIAHQSSRLNEAMDDIGMLKTKVDSLDAGATDLQADLDIAHSIIKGHARALRELLGPARDLEDYYSHDSSDEDSSDEHDTPVDISMCDNDSSLD